MKRFLLLIFLQFSVAVYAQDVAFVVYYAKGMILKKTNLKTALQKGDKIFASDIILMPAKGRLVLICNNYKGIQLAKKGNINVAYLLEQCRKNEGNFTSTYFKYVWDELTHPHGKPEKDPYKYMGNKGAASRGCSNSFLRLDLDTINYSKGKLPVAVKAVNSDMYWSLFDDPIQGVEIIKEKLLNNIHFDTLVGKLPPATYYWEIKTENEKTCERKVIKVWEVNEYKNAIASIVKSVLPSIPAETAYHTGYLLEENHFLADALSYYQLAAKLNKKNLRYKKTLLRFYE